MKSLCIAGSVQRTLDRFATSLNRAGAAAARPAIRDTEISIGAWHRKVLTTQPPREGEFATPPTLGRVWEQLAGDIFLANYNQPLWYWAESDSVHVLDFWRDFDPNTLFLLLHSSPHRALMDAIEDGEDSLEGLQAILDDWYVRTQLILRFYLRHPARSILLDSEDALAQIGSHLEYLARRWQLPLNTPDIEAPRQNDDPLALYMVDRLLQKYPDALSLHSEVQASLLQLSAGQTPPPAPELNDALADYLETRHQLLSEQRENASLHQALNTSQARLADTELTLQNQQQHLGQLQAQAEQYKQELSATRGALKSSEEENQLLLAQLHQTQEDFERQILGDQRKARELESLSAARAALQSQLEALSQNANQQISALTAARDKLTGERDQQAKLAAERQAQLDTLSKEKAALTASSRQQLDSLSAEKNTLQTRLDALVQDQQQQRAQLEETESENELLLLQLHQTQEELEQYLLQTQAIEAQREELSERLQRVLDRHPGYWEFDALEASLLENTATQQTVQWHLTDVYLGERLIPELRFKTVLANGLAGIVIQRTTDTDSPAPLLRWPSACAASEELPCVPTKGPALHGNNALLSALGPTDWNSLQSLAKKLAGLLGTLNVQQLPAGLDVIGLRDGLLALEKTLANWPKVLRYDDIQLRETLRIDGYQGLEISLTNPQLGERRWSDLDYRLATMDEPGQTFGQNPRLEFPESARSALQSWFAESEDDRGPRLELRFALPDAMDTRVWNALAGDDCQLIAALLVNLAAQLEDLRQASPANQPWQDWQALAESIKTILARNTVAARQMQGA